MLIISLAILFVDNNIKSKQKIRIFKLSLKFQNKQQKKFCYTEVLKAKIKYKQEGNKSVDKAITLSLMLHDGFVLSVPNDKLFDFID